MAEFTYQPSTWVPFRDKAVLDRVRRIARSQIDKHSNPAFKISVVPDDQLEFIVVTDMLYRIKSGRDGGRKCILILPNPNHGYIKLAHVLNKLRINCSHLHVFIMDEYANEQGEIAPESFPQGFMRLFKTCFYRQLDPDLRPPEGQMHAPTTNNIKDYGKMLADLGSADACYSGPGWTAGDSKCAGVTAATPSLRRAGVRERGARHRAEVGLRLLSRHQEVGR